MVAEADCWLTVGYHPHIVCCVSIIQDAFDRILLVLERVDGGSSGTSLRERMDRGSLDYPLLIRIIGGICSAMEHVAKQRLIHRDLKPGNVLIGDGGHAKVTDFGVSFPAGTDEDGSVAGTRAYMAPEMIGGGASEKSDVYAFGVTLWKLLTGTHPFAAHMHHRSDIERAHFEVHPQPATTVNPGTPAFLSVSVFRS